MSESSRFCRECLLQLAPGEDLGGGQTTLLRRAWERDHPEAAQAFEAWAAAPEGPPPGITSPLVQETPERPLGEWKPLDGRLMRLTVVLAAVAAFDAVNIVSTVMENDLLARIRDGGEFTDAEIESNDDRVIALSRIQGVLYIAAAVFFIQWFHRAYKNVDALRTRVKRFGEGWAIGGWFVPIMNLFRPKQIANDLWDSGTPENKYGAPPFILGAWWALFIVSNILSRFAFRAYRSEDPDEMITGNKLYIATDALDIVGAFAAIAVATMITRRLKARREEAVNPPAPAEALPA